MAKKSEYGRLLTELIKSKKISQSQFYQDLKIAKPYFYDIISGKVNPPPSETQIKISEYLQLNQVDLPPELWLTVIHGRNNDLIH